MWCVTPWVLLHFIDFVSPCWQSSCWWGSKMLLVFVSQYYSMWTMLWYVLLITVNNYGIDPCLCTHSCCNASLCLFRPNISTFVTQVQMLSPSCLSQKILWPFFAQLSCCTIIYTSRIHTFCSSVTLVYNPNTVNLYLRFCGKIWDWKGREVLCSDHTAEVHYCV